MLPTQKERTMKNLLLVLLLTISLSAQAGIAFFKYETVKGLNKVCFYDYLGSIVAITIPAIEVCPLQIEVK